MADEAPKYRLNHTSYIDDRMYLAGADGPIDKETGEEKPVYYIDKESKHTPGPHWEPVNDAAKARCKAAGVVYTGMVPDSMDELLPQLEAAKKRKEENDTKAIGHGVVDALKAGGFLKEPSKQPAKQPDEI